MKYYLKVIIRFLISLIERYEYRHLDLDDQDIYKKIINIIDIMGVSIKTDTGYHPITEIHLTQPYENYLLKTKDFKLNCADNHIVFNENMEEVFVKDLKIGDKIQTENGIQIVLQVRNERWKASMFDVTVDSDDCRFYSSGILSHNTVNSAIFILHSLLFQNDKNAMVVANQRGTTVEILDKIKGIYQLLPFFLKPGVKVWNQGSIVFDNGCRIKTAARSKTPAIGFTIDILYLDEFAHIPSNIIKPYYTAVYPTVSAIQNSKIIITSTPNGINLFHKLLTDAERLDGDPLKNNYKAKRVYWYEVEGRFVTYIRLNDHRLYEHKLTKEMILENIEKTWSDITKVEMKWDLDLEKYVIHIFNNDKCQDTDIRDTKIINGNGVEINIQAISEVTTWKDEAIKDIGGEDAFNQEYGLRFINASKSLLNESIIDALLNNKREFQFEEHDIFSRLRFPYEDLKWNQDKEIWDSVKRKEEDILISIDLSEGLGQDYSVINMFNLTPKTREEIEGMRVEVRSAIDLFKLNQIGIFANNVYSIKQIAEILYILVFEFFDPDKVQIVLELNNYGNTLLAELPQVFDGENDYGSYIFARYKHRADADEEKIGLKVGNNKNLLVKDYQDLMFSKSLNVMEEGTVKEITTFVKHETNAGNFRFAADGGQTDDKVMTLVNISSIFKKNRFKEMVEDYIDSKLDSDMKDYISNILQKIDYTEGIDYGQVLNIRNLYRKRTTSNNPWKR